MKKQAYASLLALCLSACTNAQAPGQPFDAAGTAKAKATADELRVVAVGSIDQLRLAPGAQAFPKSLNRNIVDLQPSLDGPGQFKAIPLRKGSTSVIFTTEQGEVVRTITYKVITNQLFDKFTEVRQLLKNVKGLSVEIVGEKIAVDGDVKSDADRNRILTVQAAYSDLVLNLAVPSENLCSTRICVTQAYDLEPMQASLPALDYGDSVKDREASSENLDPPPVPGAWGVADPVVKAEWEQRHAQDPIVKAMREATAALNEKIARYEKQRKRTPASKK